MAINFTATNSKLLHTTADVLSGSNVFTLCAWIFARGIGGGAGGRIFQFPEDTTEVLLRHASATHLLRFEVDFTSAQGGWTFSAVDSVWHAVALSYDGGSTANDPIARLDFANQTVTEATTPAGTFVQPLGGFGLGGRTTNDRAWDGLLAHFMVANVIWTAQEMDAALKNPGCVRRGLRLHIEDETGFDRSGNGFHATPSALTFASGPPCMPYPLNCVTPTGISIQAAPPAGSSVPAKMAQYARRRAA